MKNAKNTRGGCKTIYGVNCLRGLPTAWDIFGGYDSSKTNRSLTTKLTIEQVAMVIRLAIT